MRFIQVLLLIQNHFFNPCVNTNTDPPVLDPIAVWGLGSNSLEPNRTVLCFQLKDQQSNLSLPSFTVLFCPPPPANFLFATLPPPPPPPPSRFFPPPPPPPPPQLASLNHSHSFYLNLFNQGLALINSWPLVCKEAWG